MKMRWFLAGLAALMITGGGATVAQRVITQKTRGVLPEKDDSAHPDSRPATQKVELVHDDSIALLAATTPPPPAVVAAPTGEATTPSMPDRPEVASPLPAASEPRPVYATTAVIEAPIEQLPASTAEPGPPQADPAVSPTTAASPEPSAPTAGPVAAPAAPPADPVASVENFVERNRKEAETAIETLTAEAANLKERLAKVEVALTRWQSFSRALNVDPLISHPDLAPAPKANWKRSPLETSARPPQPSPPEESPAPPAETPKPAIGSSPEPPKSEAPPNPPLAFPVDVPEAKPATPEPTPRPPTEPPVELPPPQG